MWSEQVVPEVVGQGQERPAKQVQSALGAVGVLVVCDSHVSNAVIGTGVLVQAALDDSHDEATGYAELEADPSNVTLEQVQQSPGWDTGVVGHGPQVEDPEVVRYVEVDYDIVSKVSGKILSEMSIIIRS